MEVWAQLLVSVAVLITSVTGFIKLWIDLRSVHTIVNSQRTAMEAKIEELRTLLRGQERPVVSPSSKETA